jgi:hypothetical protein
MAEFETDIAQFESLLRRLEKEYDQFFAGLLRREPSETENAVLTIMRTWANRTIQNPTQAFRFNTLVARYNSFKPVWARRQREREEGRGGPGASRRTLVPSAQKGPAERRAAERPAAGEEAAAAPYLSVDPRHETRRLRELYEAYRKVREECGESVEKLRLESFQKSLAEKVEKLKQAQGCDAVLIRVLCEGGRSRIVAKPFRRHPGPGGTP